MKRVLPVLLVSLLAACGTSVPLNEAPVADASASQVAPSTAAASTAASSQVTAVDVASAAQSAPPVAQARVFYFDYDSYVIKPEFQSAIAAHAKYLKSKSSAKVMIDGHTDEQGGREYNLALGQRRADAVKSALAILGVGQNQMESVSFGKEKPAVVGNSEEAYSKNRRSEIRYQ